MQNDRENRNESEAVMDSCPIRNVSFLSCVTTLYRSEDSVREFVERMGGAAKQLADDYELILVDDGSPDRSADIVADLQASDHHLVLVRLSRNFGHHAAVLAGLEQARGDLVFFVDSDLEERPEALLDFHRHLINDPGLDVVHGVYDTASKPWAHRTTSWLFWRVIRAISHVDIEPDIANVRLMKRDYVAALISLPDRNIFLGGMFAWLGFRQKPVLVERTPRSGPSAYSWVSRIRLGLVAALAFSTRPLVLVFGLGLAITLASFGLGLYLMIRKLLVPDAILSGFTSLMVSLWFFGGVLIGSVGIVGLYVAHIYNQVRERPRFIVKSRTGREG